ncbi:Uncharacterised protein [uncultured archaeon]|nr:Uncharacterised protein [uncultured archaeon]
MAIATGGLYMAFHKIGQGATEYLIMLAAILIIALVALALLGFFPGISSDAKVSQSASYWRSEAKPISILEHHTNTTGYITLVLLNVDASGMIRIKNITIDGSFNDSFSTSTGDLKIGPGEQKTVTISGVEAGDAGTLYDFPINITYTSANGVLTTQYGLKTLVGKYS